MATDESTATEKSASRELLAILLSPEGPRAPLPDLEEIERIIELGSQSKSKDEVTQT